MRHINWVKNRHEDRGAGQSELHSFDLEQAEQVRAFHRKYSGYAPTPLCSLDGLAHHFGVGGIYVKDESRRFSIFSFKILGGTYAVGNYVVKAAKLDSSSTWEDIRAASTKIGPITFVSATDGNHGRGVAWAARELGHKAIIYMPKGSSQRRLEHIQACGAEATVTDFNYDDTVRMAAGIAQENGYVMVQDTAWSGYTEIPTWVMQGYLTMVMETLEQLEEVGVDRPTHVFLQAGVGSFAGAAAGLLASKYGQQAPLIIVMEPHQAAPLYLSACTSDGQPYKVGGDLETIMAGLSCGEPNPVAWEILRSWSSFFMTCSDPVTARGMRILGNPIGNDERVVAGESGAVGAGVIASLLEGDEPELSRALGLNEGSRILLFNTEGDTDPESYRKIVWNGEFPWE